MREVFRKKITRYRLNGKVVSRDTPGAVKTTEQTAKYYGEWTDARGKRKSKALSRDKSIARQMLARIMREVEREKAGLTDSTAQHQSRPLSDHLADFRAVLEERGNTAAHVQLHISRIQRILTGCRFRNLSDLDRARVTRWLSEQRRDNPKFGAVTSNHHATAIKAFTKWLREEGRIAVDPLFGLKRINPKTDRRHVRRALPSAEFNRLLQTVLQSPRTDKGTDWQFTPADRHALYLTASLTGLRASELAGLTVDAVDFSAACLTVPASLSKNRTEAVLPIHPDLLQQLERYTDGLPDDASLWPGSWAAKRLAGRILKRDLKEAGIPFQDSRGRVFDFHSLRGQFATVLAASGVHPSEAQKLLRHSDINLTMSLYTRPELETLRSALGKVKPPQQTDGRD